MSEVLKVIKERRSVRRYEAKDIPVEAVEKLKEALIWAPSAANLQARKFYFVFNPEIKTRLAELSSPTNKIFINQAPLLIVACVDASKMEKFGERGLKVYLFTDLAASLENAALTARDLGLGSCWVGRFEAETVGKILNLPAGLRPELMLTVGYAAETPAATERLGADQAVTEVR